jgi:hypothetical protein
MRLYWSFDLLRYAHGLFDEVDLEPTTKATAENMIVHDYFFRRQTGHFGRNRLGSRLHLNPDPDLARIGSHVRGTVHRLHRRVREKRHLVCCVQALALSERLGRITSGLGNDPTFLAGPPESVSRRRLKLYGHSGPRPR